ncbi:MFS transporter [Corynebacterium pyruviciproducens]|nr:MFS transporter [Corynebacterium pyruviciproducens]
MAFFVAVQLNWTPIVGMILAGIGGGLFGPLIMVIVTQTVPNEIRGRAFSLYNAIGLFASPIGLVIVTGLLQALNIYQVCIVLSVAFLGVGTWGATRGWAVLPDRADASAQKPAGVGRRLVTFLGTRAEWGVHVCAPPRRELLGMRCLGAVPPGESAPPCSSVPVPRACVYALTYHPTNLVRTTMVFRARGRRCDLRGNEALRSQLSKPGNVR